jgi:hypothetical protein
MDDHTTTQNTTKQNTPAKHRKVGYLLLRVARVFHGVITGMISCAGQHTLRRIRSTRNRWWDGRVPALTVEAVHRNLFARTTPNKPEEKETSANQ